MEARAAVSMGCSSGLLESFLESAQPHRLSSNPKRHTTRRLILRVQKPSRLPVDMSVTMGRGDASDRASSKMSLRPRPRAHHRDSHGAAASATGNSHGHGAKCQ